MRGLCRAGNLVGWIDVKSVFNRFRWSEMSSYYENKVQSNDFVIVFLKLS